MLTEESARLCSRGRVLGFAYRGRVLGFALRGRVLSFANVVAILLNFQALLFFKFWKFGIEGPG